MNTTKKIQHKKPLVGIIIINFNNNEDTMDCIDSCKQLSYRHYKLYLVDNGSDYPIKLNQLSTNNHYIQLDKNIGFAGAVNIGIKKAMRDGASYIWLLNNDTLVKKNTLNSLVKCALKNARYAIFGSIINYYVEPKKIWFGGGYLPLKDDLEPHINCKLESPKNPFEVDWVCGCSMFVRTEVIKKIGLMSERYFLYWEDVDWCQKFLKKDYGCMMVPNSLVLHKVGATAGKNKALQLRYHIRNKLWFWSKKNFIVVLKFLFLQSIIAIKNPTHVKDNLPLYQGIIDFILCRKGEIKS